VALNLAIFDLEPLWGVTQIYPTAMDCEDVDPGDERELRLTFSIPSGLGLKSVVHTIKAFVTVDRTCFRFLERESISIDLDAEFIATQLDEDETEQRYLDSESNSSGYRETLISEESSQTSVQSMVQIAWYEIRRLFLDRKDLCDIFAGALEKELPKRLSENFVICYGPIVRSSSNVPHRQMNSRQLG